MIASRLCAAPRLQTVLLASRILIPVRVRINFRRRPLLQSLQHAHARPCTFQLDVPLFQLEYRRVRIFLVIYSHLSFEYRCYLEA